MTNRMVRSVSLIVLCAAVAAGCGKDMKRKLQKASAFSMSTAVPKQTIDGFAKPALTTCDLPAATGLQRSALAAISIDIKSASEMKGYDVKKLNKLSLTQIELSIVEVPAGDRDDFDFLDSIRFWADVPNDDKKPILIATLDPVPRGAKKIVAKGTGVDIKNVASAKNFKIVTDVKGRPPCDDIVFQGAATFRVEPF